MRPRRREKCEGSRRRRDERSFPPASPSRPLRGRIRCEACRSYIRRTEIRAEGRTTNEEVRLDLPLIELAQPPDNDLGRCPMTRRLIQSAIRWTIPAAALLL